MMKNMKLLSKPQAGYKLKRHPHIIYIVRKPRMTADFLSEKKEWRKIFWIPMESKNKTKPT